MFKELWNFLPTWYKIVMVVFLIMAIPMAVYTINKCGFVRTAMLGNGATYAAFAGMCDD